MSPRILISLLLLTAVGCSKQVPTAVRQAVSPPAITFAEAARVISLLGFSTRDMRELPEYFLVEGDILFRKDKLAARLPGTATPPGSRAPATPYQAYNGFTLSLATSAAVNLYTDSSMPTSPPALNWYAAIDSAVATWSSIADCRVHITEWGSPPPVSITIRNDVGVLPSSLAAVAEYPSDPDHPGWQIRVNVDFLYNNQPLSDSQKRFILVHELGHCLSFRHTNWDPLHEPQASEIGHGVPTSDVNSVMNGITAGYPWTAFSQYDILAAQLIYPLWTNYKQLGDAVWTNTEAMTSLNSYVFLSQNSRLYRADTTNGTYTQLGGAIWTGTQGMTALIGYLYMVQNSRLYRVDSSTGAYTQIGAAVWGSTQGMTTLNGYLYIVQNSRLYRVDSVTGSYTQLGGVTWGGVVKIAPYGGYLYIVQNSRLYRVDSSNGSYAQLGGAVWGSAQGLTANGTSLYIVQNDLYYKVSPTDGSFVRLGGIWWGSTYCMTSLGANNYIAQNSRLYRVGI